MHYPDAPLRSQADFLAWYKEVTDNVVFNSHDLTELEIEPASTTRWQVSFNVRWQARAANGEHYDVVVNQRVNVVNQQGQLKIAKLRAHVVNAE